MPKIKLMTFSIICPVFNESSHIDVLLEYLSNVNPKPNEVFLVDGKSTDGTIDRIIEFTRLNSHFKILHNEKQSVPFALNLAIPLCTGDIIVRLDAHTEYSSDYFLKILQTFEECDVDIVGGPMRTKATSVVQESVAYATSIGFGIGNSDFHFPHFRGYTTSVYLGAWKKDIFHKIGIFDIRFKRNQDDEFHYRASQYGLKIFQNPDIKLWYYPRNSLKKLFSQYFQYGLYKPMVLLKIKSSLRLRHLIPSLFVLYLLFLTLTSFFYILFLIPLGLYLLLDVYFSFNNHLKFITKLINMITFPTLHLGYGLGMILGVFKLISFEKSSK